MSQATTEENGPLLLSIKRTALLLGLSEWQVRNLIVEEMLPATKVGNRFYVPAASVSDYVAQIADAS
jgi:excisionase family DNA binding protein